METLVIRRGLDLVTAACEVAIIRRRAREARRLDREVREAADLRRDAWAREVAAHMFGIARRRGRR